MSMEYQRGGELIELQALAREFRAAFPMPMGPSAEVLDRMGATRVEPVEPPEAEEGFVAVRDGIEEIEGVWYQKWAIVPEEAD